MEEMASDTQKNEGISCRRDVSLLFEPRSLRIFWITHLILAVAMFGGEVGCSPLSIRGDASGWREQIAT